MSGRIATLDGLRGVAVLGILAMNIVGFALPDAAYTNPDHAGPASTADRLLWALGFVVVDGKARGLFALLFGAGILLLAERAEAAGRDAVGPHLRRMAALFVLGCAHFYLFWPGDILTDYAVVGLFALLAVPLSVRMQATLGAAALATAFVAELGHVDALGIARAEGGAVWAAANAYMGHPSAADLAAEAARHQTGFVETARARMRLYGWHPLFGDMSARLEAFAFMMAGMVGLRAGLFAGMGSRRLATGAVAAGLGLMLALAAWCWMRGFDPLVVAWATLVWSLPVRPVLVIGGVVLLAPLLSSARLRAAGRTALSNYLGATILFAAVFQSWGLGVWGALPRTGLLPLVLVAWGAMLWWPTLWLRRFAMGPFEWLWRSMAAGRPVPLRRERGIASASQ